MRKLSLTAVMLVCLLLTSMLSAAAGADAGSAVVTARTEMWKDLNSGGIGSAAVAIMDGGKIVYSEGFGMADREKSVPVDRYTLFNIGSVSKMYVAAAIMALVDDGKVDLDQPVIRYLPEFTMADERYKEITVRMTISHTSGLPGTSEANNFGYAFNRDVYKDTLAALSQSNLKHRPGEMNPYCNDGFTLAEMVVVRVSGQSFMDFLGERVFKPLALSHTGPGVGMWPPGKGVKAAKFYPPGKLASEPLEVLSVLGAGGLAATAEDLCRFADTFSGKGPQILSAKSLAEMRKAQPVDFHGKLHGSDISWGLGWDITDHELYRAQGIQVLGKGGNTGTYTAQVYTAPDQRVSVAVVSTGKAGGAFTIASEVLAVYLADKGLMKKAEKAVTPPVKARPIPAEMKAFEGYYHGGAVLLRAAFEMDKGTLTIYKVDGKKETPVLTAVYNAGYFHRDDGKIYFSAIDGRSYMVKFSPSFMAHAVSGEKLEPVAAPVQLAVAMDGQKWLRRNVKAFEGAAAAAGHVIASGLPAALPGYVEFGSVMKIESPIFAGMAVKSLRDLTELRLIEKDGRLWAWLSGLLFMPADMAGVLDGGQTTRVIGKDGYNEWLKVAGDCVLSFAKPAQGRVIVFDADGTVTYDSTMDKGEAFAAAGGFVELAGDAGDSFTVTARPVE